MEQIQRLSKIAKHQLRKARLCLSGFNLLDTLSVKDNILLPLVLSRRPITGMMQSVTTCTELGINKLQEKFPYEISGGPEAAGHDCACHHHYWKSCGLDEPT